MDTPMISQSSRIPIASSTPIINGSSKSTQRILKSNKNHPERKSKVGEYITKMQTERLESRNIKTNANINNPSLNLSLEDLYLGEVKQSNIKLSPDSAQKELRKTERIIREKDYVILKLREACQDLSLKYAEAENRIDEIRFRKGSHLKKSQSEIQLLDIKNTKDQSTETIQNVLAESCSTWIEKVQNWKTESHFNASADADSGFRGSDLEHETPKSRIKKNRLQTLILESANQKPESEIETTNPTVSFGTVDYLEATPGHTTRTRSSSYTSLYWPTTAESPSTNQRRAPSPSTNQRRDPFNSDFTKLQPLLLEATEMAKRVQKKSRKLNQLLESSTHKKI